MTFNFELEILNISYVNAKFIDYCIFQFINLTFKYLNIIGDFLFKTLIIIKYK